MPTVTAPTSKINIVFYGDNPFFLNIGQDLERAGCTASYFPTINSACPKFGAFDAANVKTGDKIPLFELTGKNPVNSALPKVPNKITNPSQAAQYAKWLLQANGYLVEDPQ